MGAVAWRSKTGELRVRIDACEGLRRGLVRAPRAPCPSRRRPPRSLFLSSALLLVLAVAPPLTGRTRKRTPLGSGSARGGQGRRFGTTREAAQEGVVQEGSATVLRQVARLDSEISAVLGGKVSAGRGLDPRQTVAAESGRA